MRVATWNVNGIRAREAQVHEWIVQERPDVLCLQEIKAAPEKVPASLCELEGYTCRWHGHKGYSGVGLHLNCEAFGGVAPRYFHPDFDHETRIVAAELGRLVFASVYVPNGGKDLPAKFRFLEAMLAWVKQLHADGRSLVLCGDLNVALEERDVHPRLRKEGQIGTSAEERALLGSLLDAGLVDLGRKFAPDDDALFTWWAPWRNLRERNMGWRIDYVLVSEGLAPGAVSCTAHREFGTSDHGPVQAELQGIEPLLVG